jgi:hypothetical protein
MGSVVEPAVLLPDCAWLPVSHLVDKLDTDVELFRDLGIVLFLNLLCCNPLFAFVFYGLGTLIVWAITRADINWSLLGVMAVYVGFRILFELVLMLVDYADHCGLAVGGHRLFREPAAVCDVSGLVHRRDVPFGLRLSGYPYRVMARWVGLLALWLTLVAVWAQDSPRVQAGDSLRITVEGDESLSRVYVVDSSGAFRMPLIGLVQAAGRTTDELAREIARRLREGNFYRDPKVTVEIAQRAQATVTVQGAVRRGGDYPLQAGWRLSDALNAAQPTDTADLSAVRLERVSGERLTLNHLKFVQEGDESANPVLQAGDRIFVPLRAGG